MEVHTHTPIKLTALLAGKAPQALKRCPKCASFFVTDSECESCGYQLAFDGLGAPFSERSYYGLVENFYQQRGVIFRLFPRLADARLKKCLGKPKLYPKELKFLGRLNQRFTVLSQYFLDCDNYDLSERKLYLLEWRELCLFLLDVYGQFWVSSKLDELIEEKTKATKVNLLMGFYSRALDEHRRKSSTKKLIAMPKLLNYSGALIIIFLASISALALMKYFTLMGR